VKEDALTTMPDAVRSSEIVTDDAHIGRYRILRRLEMNSISEMVLAVTDGAFGFERAVIIKRLLPHAKADPTRARSFGREASAYARLTHPAIVRLYDFFTVDEMPAMVLEHVEGVSLQTLMEALRERGEKLPITAALYVGTRIFAALSAAHAAREPASGAFAPVIHRDVSPGNVRLGCDGEVKLANFGFAKLVGTAGTDTNLEAPKGTLGYMAPEQLLGGPVSPRADVYAGALLLRELLSGEPAFVRGKEVYVDYLQSMAKPSLAPIATVCPKLPRAVALTLQKALEPESEKRTLSAVDVQRVLNAHREDGRAKLVDVLKSLGLVRIGDPEHPSGEHAYAESADDPERSSHGTMPSLVRLEARAHRARLATAAFAACAVLFALFAARPGLRAARGGTVPASAPAPAIALTRPSAPVAPTPSPGAPAPAALAAAEVPLPPATSLPPTTGDLRTLAAPVVHRVFVDGVFAGSSGDTLTVPCGTHGVRIGGAGKTQSVTVPCGGTITISTR
jgi:serine/threonine protein kinase